MSEISQAAASPWSIHGKRHNRDDRGPALATDHRLLSGCREDVLGKVSVASEVRGRDGVVSLGRHQLRGLPTPHELFAPV